MPHVEKTTAIVVNWNAGEHLTRCVEVLLAQKGVDMDVVVVDNASSDGSPNALSRFGNRVRVVQTCANLGFGRGVNRGVAASQAEYVLVLNPDVALSPEAAQCMTAYLDAHPEVGMAGPRLRDASGRVRASCGFAPRLMDEICRKFLLHLIFPLFKFRSQRPDCATPVGWVTGACFMARRDAFNAVCGFDEDIFMYYEDVDLCLRLNRAGWAVHYLPEAEGVHLGGESSKQALTRMLVVSEASYMHLIEKHLGRGSARLLAALRPVEMALRTLIWSSVYLIAPGRRREAGARLRAYWIVLTRGVQPTI